LPEQLVRPKPKPTPAIKIPENTYQPSKAALDAGLRVNTTFDGATDVLCRPVKIERVKN